MTSSLRHPSHPFFKFLFGIWNSRWLQCLEIPKAGFSSQVASGSQHSPWFNDNLKLSQMRVDGSLGFGWQWSFKRIPEIQCQRCPQGTVAHTEKVFVEWAGEWVKSLALALGLAHDYWRNRGRQWYIRCFSLLVSEWSLSGGLVQEQHLHSVVCILLEVSGSSGGYADAHGFKGMGFEFLHFHLF